MSSAPVAMQCACGSCRPVNHMRSHDHHECLTAARHSFDLTNKHNQYFHQHFTAALKTFIDSLAAVNSGNHH